MYVEVVAHRNLIVVVITRFSSEMIACSQCGPHRVLELGDVALFLRRRSLTCFTLLYPRHQKICLDSLSDAKEMENLARIAAQRSTRPSSAQDTKKASPGEETPGVRSPSPVPPVPRAVGIASDNNDSIGNGTRQDGSEDTATAVEGRLQGNALTAPGMSPSNGLKVSDSNSGSGGGEAPSSSADSGGAAGGRLQEDPAEPANGSSISAEGVGGSGDEDVSALDEAQKGKEEGSEDGNEEEPWGVILRNTIIRDLAGFGMEHAGPIGRSLISKVLSVSQDNYPEMVSGFLGVVACSPASSVVAS